MQEAARAIEQVSSIWEEAEMKTVTKSGDTKVRKVHTYSKAWKDRDRREKPKGKISTAEPCDEADELFFSIPWDKAWQMFVERREDGTFKYVSIRALCEDLVVAVDAETKKRRIGWLLQAIGKPENYKLAGISRMPHIGDWEMVRSQSFLGEVKRDSILFGTPSMLAMRQALRDHVDVMKTAKACAELLFNALARFHTWSQQVDEFYQYQIIDPSLPAKERRARTEEYTELQNNIHKWTAEAVDQVMSCFGIGKHNMQVLQQFVISHNAGTLGEQTAKQMIAGLSGVEVIQGERIEGDPIVGSNTLPGGNPTYELIMASFLEKAVTYKMPHPLPDGVRVDGIPDHDDQELSLEELHKQRLQKSTSKRTQ